jgi:hypothetical protein
MLANNPATAYPAGWRLRQVATRLRREGVEMQMRVRRAAENPSRGNWIRLVLFLVGGAILVGGLTALGRLAWKRFSDDRLARYEQQVAVLGQALDAFWRDKGTCPPATEDSAAMAGAAPEQAMPAFLRYRPNGPHALTSPIPYIKDLGTDPYSDTNFPRLYAYWTLPGGNGWVLMSCGHDGVFDTNIETLDKAFKKEDAVQAERELAPFTYDATNGSKSSGDLWQFHLKLDQPAVSSLKPTQKADPKKSEKLLDL